MMLESRLLKKDLSGEVRLESRGTTWQIVRDTAAAALPVRWLARGLMRREARALVALDGPEGVPARIAVAPVDADRQASTPFPDAQGARMGRSRECL
jgi:hypothetical protein